MIILLVDDDIDCRKLLQLSLEMHDHQVLATDDVEDAVAYLRAYDVDVVIMDPDMQQLNGWGQLRAIRAAREVSGLILLGRRLGDRHALVDGLRYADDVMTKPAHPDEVLARCEAVRRRCRQLPSNRIVIDGDVTIDIDAKNVRASSGVVHLTGREWQVLEALVTRPGRCITKDDLLSILYNERDEPELKIIDVFIFKVRKKLRDAGAPAGVIATEWGRGYRFDPTVLHAEVAA